MAKKRLSSKDIEQLLIQYRSERRRLLFQLEGARKAIRELKGMATAAAKAARSTGSENALPKRGPGRPKAAATKKAAKKKAAKRGPGRPPKRKRASGPRINEWDQMVLNTITGAKRLLPKEDLMKAAKAWAAKAHKGMKEDEVEAFLTRTLQKLSGRVKMLGMHHTGLRRGNHYGLKDWFFASSGKLQRKHFDKLILTKDDK